MKQEEKVCLICTKRCSFMEFLDVLVGQSQASSFYLFPVFMLSDKMFIMMDLQVNFNRKFKLLITSGCLECKKSIKKICGVIWKIVTLM